MASKTLVPVEEYLRAGFDEPEPEYLDGELIERRLGSFPHSEAQEEADHFFGSYGAPVPDEPRNSFRPSGKVTSLPFARFDPSLD